MSTRLAIHQPQYFPWFRYIQKILCADVFVYLDTVQFSKNGMQNRNMIKGPQGGQWLTVPVRQKLGQQIAETEIAETNFGVKHWKSISLNYAKAPGFMRFKEELENLFLAHPYSNLSELAIATTEWMLGKLSAKTKRIRSSEMGLSGEKNSRLVAEICLRLDAGTYLTGTGALNYMDPEDFKKIRCTVLVQSYRDFQYQQLFSKTGFIPDLSTLDLILNHPDEAGNLLMQNCDWRPAWPDK